MVEMILKKDGASFVASAIHNGHDIRPDLLPYLRLSENERLREEDPYTREWVQIADNRIIVSTSRFELDVNRPRELAIYLKPENAWGLEVWNEILPRETVEKSLQIYDNFYTKAGAYFDSLLSHHKNLLVYDLHSYNHRREGFDRYANPEDNPEINIGTRNLNREVWSEAIETFIECVRSYNFEGRRLDVRENVNFKGGYFGQWLYERYGDLVCTISIEVKKFFMDEWSGKIYEREVRHIREVLISTVRPVLRQAALIPIL